MRANLYDHVYGLTAQSMIASVFTPVIDLELTKTNFFKLIWQWMISSAAEKDVMKYLPESTHLLQKDAQIKLKTFLNNGCIFSRCYMIEDDPIRHVYYLKIFCLTKDFNLEAVETMMIFSQKIDE